MIRWQTTVTTQKATDRVLSSGDIKKTLLFIYSTIYNEKLHFNFVLNNWWYAHKDQRQKDLSAEIVAGT